MEDHNDWKKMDTNSENYASDNYYYDVDGYFDGCVYSDGYVYSDGNGYLNSYTDAQNYQNHRS